MSHPQDEIPKRDDEVLRRRLDNIIDWLRDIGPVLTVLGFAAVITTSTFLQAHKLVVYSVTGAFSVVLIVLREIVGLSPATRERLRIVATYISVALFVPVLLILQDIQSSVRRVERTVTASSLQDIRSSVTRVEHELIITHPPILIAIKNDPLGGLFNASYDHLLGLQMAKGVPFSGVSVPPGYTHVFMKDHKGTDWKLEGKEASFSYDRHDAGFRAPWASSGGYVTFPDIPVNRLVYEYLRFDAKVTDSQGSPDLCLRMAVDDPSLPSRDKEVAVYELPSLSRQFRAKPLSSEWQMYEVHTLGLVESVRLEKSLVDKNEISKLVFCVNDRITSKTSKGTVWIRSVVFSTTPYLGK